MLRVLGLNVADLFTDRIEQAESIDWGAVPLDADPTKIVVLGRKLQRNEDINGSQYSPSNSINSMSKDSVLQFNDVDGIDYEDVDIGPVDDAELRQSIEK